MKEDLTKMFSPIKLTQGSMPPCEPPGALTISLWKKIFNAGVRNTVQAKDYVCQVGDSLEHVSIIISGYLTLTRNTAVLDICGPGNSIAGALINPRKVEQKYPINAQALNRCEIMRIPLN